MNLSRRNGFTLIEMMVTISIVALLAGMLMPAIHSAREAARGTQCQSNLHNFGVALIGRANSPDGRFCSGNFNWERDGAVTEVGWVADMVTRGVMPSEMTCPSNIAQASKAIEQLMVMPLADAADESCVPRLGRQGYVNQMGETVMNPCRRIVAGGYAPGSVQRQQIIQKLVLDEGYNTNYAATWFLVRSEVLLDEDGNVSPRRGGCSTNIRSTNTTLGPLTTSLLGSGKAPANTVPLLADASPSGRLSVGVGPWAAGQTYATPIVGAPAHRSTAQPPSFAVGTPRTGAAGWLKVWSRQVLQDYRGISAHHRGYCNVLMADGSVKQFHDANGDAMINNGFDIGNGFTSDEVEVKAKGLASYYTLRSKGEG
ncbi:DUF1559 family PulG-like putative transporter [Roseimaritima ulvae]|uniref:DUF1559 domain-containing protein n=1 Tax=Roseimaritima ulvae TaxID=980254 RepID=A0A5B9QH60_9BACT|nr:DUF1559 domain-containing protein [Roseimaritima ulvae]QEG38457.1 hypothetical protein UC8_04140 [Roseimaritima ulvae]